MLKTRVKTAAVLAVIILSMLAFSGTAEVMVIFTAALSCLAAAELFAPVLKRSGAEAFFGLSVLAGLALAVVDIPAYAIVSAAVLVLSVGAAAFMTARLGKYRLDEPVKIFPISLAVSVLFCSMRHLRGLEHGFLYLVLSIGVAVFTDMAAYFAGGKWGRRKLAPRLSPHKTVEGAAGGLAGCFLLFVILGGAVELAAGITVRWPAYLVYLLLASVAGQFGDLAASAVKRTFGLKDFGQVLPGHGGILDRFDSLAFTAPLTLVWCVLVGGMFR